VEPGLPLRLPPGRERGNPPIPRPTRWRRRSTLRGPSGHGGARRRRTHRARARVRHAADGDPALDTPNAANPTQLQLADGTLAANTPFTLEAWVLFDALGPVGTFTGLTVKGRESGTDWIGLYKIPFASTGASGWDGTRNRRQRDTTPNIAVAHGTTRSSPSTAATCARSGSTARSRTTRRSRRATRRSPRRPVSATTRTGATSTAASTSCASRTCSAPAPGSRRTSGTRTPRARRDDPE